MAYENWKVEIAFASQPNSTSPIWTDVTRWVDSFKSPFTIEAGETPQDSDPGNLLTLRLNNSDQRFTPGNVLSPYYPNIKSARKIRVTETILEQTVELFVGYIQFPEIEAWTESSTSEPRDQTITITAVDDLARLAGMRTFDAALTEHIIYNGGTDLKGFWPMTEAAEPFYGVGPTTDPLDAVRGITGIWAQAGEVQCQTGLAPTGAESSAARMITHPSHKGDLASGYIQIQLPPTFLPAVTATDKISVVFWWAFAPTMSNNESDAHTIAAFFGPSVTLILSRNIATGIWTLSCSGAMTATITGGKVGNEALLPVGIFLDEANARMELWTGSVRQTATLTGAPPGAGIFEWDGMGYGLDYDVSYLQIYVGPNFSYTQYLEQIAQGWAPLDRQSTGQRINTVLNYARYPSGSAFRDIDNGATIMSPATLAGRTPKQVIDEATATEQGRFWANGSRVTFADRLRLLNI
jgi:hypothetical protein